MPWCFPSSWKIAVAVCLGRVARKKNVFYRCKAHIFASTGFRLKLPTPWKSNLSVNQKPRARGPDIYRQRCRDMKKTKMLRVNRTHTLHFILHITHSTLYTPYSTPDALNFALYTLHFTLHTSNSTVHIPHLYNTSHSTILTSHSTLYTLQSTLQTPHFTLYTSLHATLHFLYSTLHTPHSALPPHSTRHSLHWYGNRGRMYQAAEI